VFVIGVDFPGTVPQSRCLPLMPSRATFVTRRDLKDRSRWIALASGNFGSFSNDLLIGNFGGRDDQRIRPKW
jgi:hypothetical protein